MKGTNKSSVCSAQHFLGAHTKVILGPSEICNIYYKYQMKRELALNREPYEGRRSTPE
jgi:hypothetical protein